MTKTPRSTEGGALKPTPQWWKDQFAAWLAASDWSLDRLEKRLGIRPGSISKMLKKSSQSRLVDKLVAFTGITDPSPVQPSDLEARVRSALQRAASPEMRLAMVEIVERMAVAVAPLEPSPAPKKSRK